MTLINEICLLSHTTEAKDSEKAKTKKHIMVLPFAGENDYTLIQFWIKGLSKTLSYNIKMQIIFTGTKISSQLNDIINPTNRFKNNIMICTIQFLVLQTVVKIYIFEKARWLNESMKNPIGQDRNSHLFKHFVASVHTKY